MNKKRRQELRDWVGKVMNLKNELEIIQAYEQYSYDSTPENLQGGDRATDSEEAINQMYEAMTGLDEAIEAIEEII